MNRQKCFVFLQFLLVSSAIAERIQKPIYVLALDRFEQIHMSSKSPVKLININILYNNMEGMHASMDANVTRDLISSKLKLVMDVTKCKSKEALDTCEYFTSLKPPNLCVFFAAKGMAWSTIMTEFKPEIKCPIVKGIYLGRDIYFNTKLWKLFPLQGWYWKVEIRMYEGDLLLFGVLSHTKYITIKPNA